MAGWVGGWVGGLVGASLVCISGFRVQRGSVSQIGAWHTWRSHLEGVQAAGFSGNAKEIKTLGSHAGSLHRIGTNTRP